MADRLLHVARVSLEPGRRGEQHVGACARRAIGQLLELRFEQRLHAIEVADAEQVLAQRQDALDALGVAIGRQPQRVLRQVDRVAGRAAPARDSGRARDDERGLGIGHRGRECQVPGGANRIVERVRQLQVDRLALGRTRVLERRRREQRMGCAHALSVKREHIVARSVRDGRRAGHPGELARAEIRAQRHRQQCASDVRRQRTHARTEQLARELGGGQLGAELERAVLDQQPAQLEHHQRVAVRRLHDPRDQRARHAQPERLRDQASSVQRADCGQLEPPRGNLVLERRALAPANREQQPHALADDAPGRERERGRRCLIEPLRVIDCDQHPLAELGQAQQSERAGGDRELFRRRAGRLRPRERHFQRVALRRRELA